MGPFGNVRWALHTSEQLKKDRLMCTLAEQTCRKHNCLTDCWATWAVPGVIQVLLRVSGETALEAVLPELGEPRVAGVGAQPELQEVVVEGGDLFRVQLHGDATHRLLLVSLHHLDPVGPAVAAEGKSKWWTHK